VGQLSPVEEGHQKLAQRVLAPALIRVGDHGVVGVVVVAQLEVVGEQDVGQGGSLLKNKYNFIFGRRKKLEKNEFKIKMNIRGGKWTL